jgi:hypothetical protein
VLPILTILICLAADITVRRDGFAFQVTGEVQPGELSVFVGKGDVPPVLGKVVVVPGGLVFEPRFEIPRSIDVRVVVRGKTFEFPAETRATAPSTRVIQVYPTTDRLPANQLKFYIEFSAPMLTGEAWQHLQLLDQQNKPIDLAFLEIDQELWDRDKKRLTILFDPGRIKRGVLPRDEIGAALEAGKTYTLQINPAWRDEERSPLVAAYRKVFTVVEEDRVAINPNRWTVASPEANSRKPLVIHFHEPLDSALALRLISLPVAGVASLGANESSWSFIPDAPWAAGTFDISIDTALEDLAGNKVGRPFDVDTFNPITVRSGRGTVTLPVRIR